MAGFVERPLYIDKVFAYMSTPSDTTITLANRWYVLNGVFTNVYNHGFTLSSTGITLTKEPGYFCIDFMTGGASDSDGDIKIGIVKNGTFTDGLLDSGENILPGSGGKDYADSVGSSAGDVNPRCFWQGYLNKGDKLTLVIASTTEGSVYTPNGGSASIFRISNQ